MSAFSEINSDRTVTAVFFKKHLIQSLKELFGEVASAVDVDVLKYNENERRAILRISSDYYLKLRASLTLSGKYEDIPCAYRIHKASSHLLHLVGDSRDYIH